MKPNVFLLVIDSFRADKFYGEKKTSVTPNLDLLIKNGIYFEQTIGTAPASLPAIASMFTGLFPFESLKLKNDIYNLNPNVQTFVEILKQHNYDVYATIPKILSLMTLDHVFDKNIETYDDEITLYDGLGEKILERFDSKKMKEPWFYYLHLNDIHGPAIFHKGCVPQQFYDKKLGINQYERMISLMDMWLGKILKKLDTDNTLLIITADHGSEVGIYDSTLESYNEYNRQKRKFQPNQIIIFGHKIAQKSPKFFQPMRKKLSKIYKQRKKNIVNKKMEPELQKLEGMRLKPYQKRILHNIVKGRAEVYDDKFRIPLLLSGYGIKSSKIVSQQVRSVDIFPTIFEILDLNHSKNIHGMSLMPLILGKNFEELDAYVESSVNVTEGNTTNVIGIRTTEYKYFRDKENPMKNIHLYNLKTDPLEEENITNIHLDIVKEMECKLQKLMHTNSLKIIHED